MRRVGVIGSGAVGRALAAGCVAHGYEVMIGSRQPGKLESWAAQAGPSARTGTVAETARFGELVVLAVQGSAAEDAVRLAGPAALAGKTVIDTTNPIAGPPGASGVLPLFTDSRQSLMERLAAAAPEARFVKAFSCVGSGLMVGPDLRGGPPTMFICGDDAAAKEEVVELLRWFGWDAEDMGGAEAARAIEPLCMLWCIPGFARGDWTHAFKVLRP